jgi:HEAT repeat protein
MERMLKSWALSGIVVAVLAAGGVTGQGGIPPLPRAEIFVQQEGLDVQLRIGRATLHTLADPEFTLRFENRGSGPLYINPHVSSNLVITTSDGRPVPAAISYLAKHVQMTVRRSELIRLKPGDSWESPVIAGYRGNIYAEHGFNKDSGWALLLPPGDYVAHFTYLNAAGAYVPDQMPAGIWEGRLESLPVPFSVVAPTAEQIEADLRRMSDSRGRPTRPLLRWLAQSERALIEEFRVDREARIDILQVIRLRPASVTRALIDTLKSLPPNERDIVYAFEFSSVLTRHADCATLTFLSDELGSTRGDVISNFRPVFEKGAPQCPPVRDRLRTMIVDTKLPPAARNNAAALLGTFRSQADVPLLVDALDRTASGAAYPSPRPGDPTVRGAAAGLASIGGDAASQALTLALADERKRRLIGPPLVNYIADLTGPDAVAPLIAVLSDSDPDMVAASISALARLGAKAAIPRLVELMRHSNPRIRSASAAALRGIGAGGLTNDMRAALQDPDEAVQAQALFYLAEHEVDSDGGIFVERLASRDQNIREAARSGVRRLGRALDFPRIRALLEVPNSGVHRDVQAALAALTFVSEARRLTPAQWDEWYGRHRRTTRLEWARESLDAMLRGKAGASLSFGGLAALRYLNARNDAAFRTDFERAAAAREPTVRIEAARALARFNKSRAIALLLREFDSRFLNACFGANEALNALAGRQLQVECADPSARRIAKEQWSRALIATAARIAPVPEQVGGRRWD